MVLVLKYTGLFCRDGLTAPKENTLSATLPQEVNWEKRSDNFLELCDTDWILPLAGWHQTRSYSFSLCFSSRSLSTGVKARYV